MSASFEPTVIIQAAQPFVLAGSQHILAVQLLGNRLCAHSFQFSAVDRADNICCILVYHQTVFVPFVFAVAVDCITANELTFAPFHVQLAAHLDGNIPAVGIVQQILERNYNAVRIAALGVRIVIVVVDGDEANPHHGKNLFQILSHLNVITTKPGQVLDDDAVDFAGFNILHHPLKARTFKVGSCVAIVSVLFDQIQSWPFCSKIPNQFSLIADAVALSLVAILDGQSQIGRCPYVFILFLVKKQSH